MTKEEALELLIANIPYPEQIKDYDFSVDGRISFTWRSDRFAFDYVNISIDLHEGSCLVTANSCILMRELLKRAYVQKEFNS